MRKSSQVIDEPKAITGEELEGSNRPRLSRRACALLSWAAVAIMLAFIFCMSAKTGNDLDNHSGIVSIVKNFLVAGATALFGHEVDVSPWGISRNTCCLAPRSQTRCVSHHGPYSRETRPRAPQACSATSPPRSSRSSSRAFMALATSSTRFLPPAEAATLWIGLSTPAPQPLGPLSYGRF